MLEYAINAIKVEVKVIKIQLENEIFVVKSQAQAKSLSENLWKISIAESFHLALVRAQEENIGKRKIDRSRR